MDHDPPEPEIAAFAARHGLTLEQARRVLDEHGDDETGWSEAAHNLVRFLKAPS